MISCRTWAAWLGTGDRPADRWCFTFGNVAEGTLALAIRFETPCKTDLIGPFILPYPVRCIHIPAVLCFLDSVRVILGEMDLTLEGD